MDVESSREKLPASPSGGKEVAIKPVSIVADNKKAIVPEAESTPSNPEDLTLPVRDEVKSNESTDEKILEESCIEREYSMSNGKKSDQSQGQEVKVDGEGRGKRDDEDDEVKSQGEDPEAIVLIGAEESNDGVMPTDERRPSHLPNATQEKPTDDTTQEDMEENQSSNSSSPSALHIHLDEEKDESQPAGDNKDISDATDPDPPLPLISNVVSLSDAAASSAFSGNVVEVEELTTIATTPEEEATNLSVENSARNSNSNSNNTRRATLRLKRGIELSFEVDQNGQPVPANDPSTSASAVDHSSSPSKRGRFEDDETTGSDSLSNEPDLSEMDAEGTASVLAKVQKDIRTLRFMAKQKEKEWNYILKLMKIKEELQAKLMRRREVLKITTAKRHSPLPSALDHRSAGGTSIAALSAGTSPAGNQSPNLQSLINQSLSAIMTHNKGHPVNPSPKINTAVSSSHSAPAVNPQMKSHAHRQRPILPKPIQVGPDLHSQPWNVASSSIHGHHLPTDSGSESHHQSQQDRDARHRQGTVNVQSLIADFRAGVDSQLQDRDSRNRQGTINVQSLIADHRAKHPEEIPTRGRRVRQSSKMCGDLTSSNSPTPPPAASAASAAHMTATEPSNMSFKDVLLQFAKMSSRHGHNSADLVQLGIKDNSATSMISNSHSLLAGGSSSSSNSSTAALQNLAARNARNNPSSASTVASTTGISAGSILQNALSGSGGRVNPGFAPTLAQLLTNPAAEQQQQQQQVQQQQQQQVQQQLPQQQIMGPSGTAIQSAAEVLTLSNLLATTKGNSSTGRSSSGGSNSSGNHSNTASTVASSGSSSTNGRTTANSAPSTSSTNGDVPKCQGCNERVAQFVCAGCSSQWYCSRECQVAAWEEHSENCVG